MGVGGVTNGLRPHPGWWRDIMLAGGINASAAALPSVRRGEGVKYERRHRARRKTRGGGNRKTGGGKRGVAWRRAMAWQTTPA